MAKQLNISLNIDAQTNKAKQALTELNKILTDIQTNRTITINDTSLQEAKQAASDLKFHLAQATSVDTGRLNLGTFSQSLKKAGQDLNTLYNKLSVIGPEGQKAFLALSQSIVQADHASLTLGSRLSQLGTTLANTARWQASSSILHGIMGAIQGAYGYAQDLNKSLNNIRIVTGQNIDQMAQFAEKANKAAKALSTSTTSYTNAALIYYQQGLTGKEVTERTETTIKLANVSRQSAEEVSDQMTAIWNNFYDGSQSLEYYADVITKLGAATASSSDEISQGLQKFAAVADTVGLSYEKATAALATVVAETRQSADVVGTAFKTMFARFQGLQLGETLEDGVTLNKYSEALGVIGVKILDANGNLRIMDDILDDTAKKWNTITEAQQVALAETVAGTRQYAQFMAIMENYDKILANQDLAAGAEGTLQKQADIYAESWEAASKRVRAAAQGIYQDLLDDKFFITSLNWIEKIISTIQGAITGIGGLKTILLAVSSIIATKYANEMPAIIQKLVGNFNILTGAAERNRIQMIQDANAIIQKMDATEAGTKGFQAQIGSMQLVSKMTTELEQKKKNLSKAEIENYELKIKEVQIYGQMATAIGQEIDALEKEASTQKLKLNSNLYKSGNLQKKYYTEEEQKKIDEMRDLRNIEASLLGENSAGAKKKLQETQQAIQQLGKEINNLMGTSGKTGSQLLKDFSAISQKAGTMTAAYNQASDRAKIWQQTLKSSNVNIEKTKEEMMAYADVLKKAGFNVDEFKKAISEASSAKELDNALQKLINTDEKLAYQMYETDEQVEKFKQALINMDVPETELNKLEQILRESGERSQEFAAALQQVKQKYQELQPHTISLSESFSRLSGITMSLSSALNAIKNIGSIWNDDDLSKGEKLFQTLTSLGMLLPALNRLLDANNLKVLASSFSIKGLKAAITAYKTTAGAATVSTAAFGAALKALPIGWILTAIGLLVGGIALLAKIIVTPAEKLKGLKESTKDFTEATDTAIEHWKNLNNTISNYETAYNSISQLTKGTQEFIDAVKRANEEAENLINDLGMTFGIDYFFDANGVKTFTTEGQKKIEQANKKAQQLSNYASYTNTYTEQEVKHLEYDRDQEELRKSGGNPNQDIWGQYQNTSNSEVVSLLTNRNLLNSPEKIGEIVRDLQTAYPKEMIQGLDEVALGNIIKKELQDKGIFIESDDKNAVMDIASMFASLVKQPYIAAEPNNYNIPYAYNYANLNAGLLQSTNLTDDELAQTYINNRHITKEEIEQYQKEHYTADAKDRLLNRGLTEDQIKSVVGKDKAFNTESDYEAFLQMMDDQAKNLEETMTSINSLLETSEDKDLITNLINNDLHKISAEDMQRIVAGEFGEESLLKQIFDIIFPEEDYNKFIQRATKNWDINDVYRANVKDINEIRESIKDYNKELKSLKLGDVIQSDVYEKLSEGAKTYFTLMEDGTYKLVGNAQQLQDILFKEATADFDANLQNLSNIESDSLTPEDNAKIQENAVSYAMASETLEQLNYVKERFNEIGIDIETQVLAENAALQDLATKYESCADDLEAYQHALTTNNLSLTTAAKETLKYSITVAELAEKHGFDAKETEAYAKRLRKDLAPAMKAAGFNEDQLKQSALTAAIANQRLDRGLTNLNKNLDSYKEILVDTNKGTFEWSTTMDALKTDIADIVNMDMSVFTDKFAEDLLNDVYGAGLLEQALNGDIEAIKKIQEYAADDMILSIKADLPFSEAKEFQTIWNDLKIDMAKNIETGGVDQSELIASFNKLVEKGHMTKSEIEAALSGLHVAADVVTTYNKQKVKVPQYVTYETVESLPNPYGSSPIYKKTTHTVQQEPVEVDGWVPSYEIKGTTGSGSASIATRDTPLPPTSPMPGVSSIQDLVNGVKAGQTEEQIVGASYTGTPITTGFSPLEEEDFNFIRPSAGAGKSTEKDNRQSAKEHKDVKNEIDRYHVLNEQLDDLSSAYDKASKAKDRLFGKDRLQAIQNEQTALDKLIKHNQAYLSAANAYREQDKNALLNGGLTRQWVDSDGNIKPYTSTGASIDLQFDEEGVLLNYEEFLASIVDAYNQAVDEYNNIVRQENVSETEVKAAEDTFKQAELQYELIKEAFEKYEESNQIFQDKLEEIRDQFREQQDKRFEEWSYKLELKLKIIDEDKRYLEYFRKQLDRFSKSIYAPVTELLSIWNSTNTDSDWKILKAGTENLKNAASDLMNATHGDPIIDEKTGELLSDFDYSQADWMSALDDVEDKIYEQIDALYELDETMSNYYSETLSEAETKLDQYMTKMEDCTAVIKHFQTILSLLGKEQNYEWTGEVLEAQRETIQNELQSSTKEYELAKQQYDIMLARYEADKNSVDESTRELMERELQAQYESMSKWHEKMLSKTEEYAEAVNAIYENTIKKIGKAFEEAATSGQGWESLLNSLDRVSAYQDLILTRTNQVYETNKLMRKLSQDIDKTDNVAAKTKLANFKQEIQDMQNLNRMSKFDLDVANARYEVLKAQIALEEAQNAKSTVRLQRDSEGNYGYVYTADQNQIDDAEQALADKRNDLYNLTLNKANENARALAQLDQEMYAELERIALEYKDDEVKMQEERNRVIEEYAQKRSVLVHDYSEADYWQQRVSVTQTNEAYGDAYRQNLLDTDKWQIKVSEMVGNIDKAYSTWTDDMDTYVRPVVGTDLDELKQKTDDLRDASEKYQTWFDNFADTNNERLEQIAAITNAYFNQRQEVELLIEQLRTMADEIKNIRAAESGMSRILTGSVGYDPNVDYSALMNEYLENGGKRTDSEYLQLQAAREAKIDGEGYSADQYGARGQEFENLLDYYMANNLTGSFAAASQAYAAENGDSWQDVLSGNTEAQKEQAQIVSESTGILKEKADEIMERASLTTEENNTLEEKLISDISEQKEDLIKSHQEIKDTLISDVNKEFTEANDAFGTHLSNSSTKIDELRDSLSNAAKDINEAASSIRSSVLEASRMVSGAMSMISNLAYSIKSESFDTGGYTGSWGSSGKIAMLHEKELVLNATDTANILSTIDIVRQLNSAIDLRAVASNFTAGLNSPSYQAGAQTLEQEVTIHAEFPNATNHSEIEEAFNNLINRASQYANRPAIYENIN